VAESVLESARCPECLPTSVIVDHEKAGSALISGHGYESAGSGHVRQRPHRRRPLVTTRPTPCGSDGTPALLPGTGVAQSGAALSDPLGALTCTDEAIPGVRRTGFREPVARHRVRAYGYHNI
jgi:hypothetical protein